MRFRAATSPTPRRPLRIYGCATGWSPRGPVSCLAPRETRPSKEETPPYQWSWQFGDDAGGDEGQTVEHTYTAADADGTESTGSVTVEVRNPDAGKFSDVEYFGHVDNWEMKTPSRWRVVEQDGDDRPLEQTGAYVISATVEDGNGGMADERDEIYVVSGGGEADAGRSDGGADTGVDGGS